MEDLARANRVVERALNLLDRRGEVPPMDVIKVDVIEPQSLEAGVERLGQALAMNPGRIRIACSRNRIGIFGGDDEAFAVARDEPPDDALALAPHVHVRGVDEIAARLSIGLEHRARLVFRPRPFDPRAEGHRSKRDLRNPKTASAKQRIAHSVRPQLLVSSGLSRHASSGPAIRPSWTANSRKFQCVRQRTILPSR